MAAQGSEANEILVRKVCERARKVNMKFNPKKFQFKVHEVKCLGHILSGDVVRIDSEKVSAISKMPIPDDKQALRRFTGMVRVLAQYIPKESSVTAKLRELLRDDADWTWIEDHQRAVDELKKALATGPRLALFDHTKDVVIQADASKSGLGACLMQDGQPVACASRAMTGAEERYAQIEKELLAICYGSERFRQYVIGKKVHIQSNHKPLEMIVTKPINMAPLQLQRMMIKLQSYDVHIMYCIGKEMYLADTLSRAIVDPPEDQMDADALVYSMKGPTFAPMDKVELIQSETGKDPELSALAAIITDGWPRSIKMVPLALRQYWSVRDCLTFWMESCLWDRVSLSHIPRESLCYGFCVSLASE